MRVSLAAAVVVALIVPGCRANPSVPPAADPRPLLEAFMRVWNQQDSAAVLDTLVSSNALHEDLAFGFQGTGPAGFKGYLVETLKQIPDFTWRTTATLVEGPRIAVEWTLSGTFSGATPTGPVVGRRFAVRGASVVVTEAGKISRFSDYYNAAEFFRQVTADSTVK